MATLLEGDFTVHLRHIRPNEATFKTLEWTVLGWNVLGGVHIVLSNLRYEIMNFQHVTPGVYDYINIGSWHEGVLSLDEEMIQMNRSDMVRSVCSEPCSKGEIKVRDKQALLLSFLFDQF